MLAVKDRASASAARLRSVRIWAVLDCEPLSIGWYGAQRRASPRRCRRGHPTRHIRLTATTAAPTPSLLHRDLAV